MEESDVVSPTDEATIRALVQEGKVAEARVRLTSVFQSAFPESDEDTTRLLAVAWMFARRFRSLLIHEQGVE